MRHGSGNFSGNATTNSIGGGYTFQAGHSAYTGYSSIANTNFNGKINYEPDTIIHDYVINIMTSDVNEPTIIIPLGHNQNLAFEIEKKFRAMGIKVKAFHR